MAQMKSRDVPREVYEKLWSEYKKLARLSAIQEIERTFLSAMLDLVRLGEADVRNWAELLSQYRDTDDYRDSLAEIEAQIHKTEQTVLHETPEVPEMLSQAVEAEIQRLLPNPSKKPN